MEESTSGRREETAIRMFRMLLNEEPASLYFKCSLSELRKPPSLSYRTGSTKKTKQYGITSPSCLLGLDFR